MLELSVPGSEWFDESTQEFITVEPTILHLEHSLISISKWESKWHKPFLSVGDLYNRHEVNDQMLSDYISCMSIDGPLSAETIRSLSPQAIQEINDYIGDKMTATWFAKEEQKTARKEIITSEVIYYWMFSLNIPKECETWHINRLLTLIRVFNENNKPQKKQSAAQIAKRNAALNATRRKSMKSRG